MKYDRMRPSAKTPPGPGLPIDRNHKHAKQHPLWLERIEAWFISTGNAWIDTEGLSKGTGLTEPQITRVRELYSGAIEKKKKPDGRSLEFRLNSETYQELSHEL